MKLVLLLVIVLVSFTSPAQDDHVWKPASRESAAYHEYRIKITMPPYGLSKIKALIAKIEVDDEDTEALEPGVYNALSLREKFTYHMIHAESYSQDSDPMPPIQDEHKKIFAHLPVAFDEYNWSDRQSAFLKRNRDSVIALMKESITRTKRVGLNFKHAIIEINAKEMIPLLITAYNATKKDLDILTLLMLLMKENEYEPFLVSASYKKLYSADSGYLSYLSYNNSNEDLVIKRA
ncbi:MAG TPA: hypothetical protein VIZ28_10180, partial [Chitinophagaceae bacterium]